MLAAVQAVEVGDTVDAEQHRFAVQDQGAGPVTQRGFDDAWVSTAPVVAVAGARLEALVRDRNVPQKQVWGAEIVLLSADGLGINEIMHRTGKSKTCVWRWQERFMQEGFEGLLRDKTRPSRIPPLGANVAARVVALTQTDPPGEATHWTATMMAKEAGISAS